MILSGKEIEKRVESGDILIRPFDKNKVNPNSYNLKLHDELVVYDEEILDMAKNNAYHTIKIPKEGLVLEPGKLYLGRTMEYTETHNLVPMLEGRSSVGRLGVYIHVTAGFGDVGFAGCWTLEIQVVEPVRIYPFMDICQIYYHTIEGEIEEYSVKGKYQGATGIQTSRLWREFDIRPYKNFKSVARLLKDDMDSFTLFSEKVGKDLAIGSYIQLDEPIKDSFTMSIHEMQRKKILKPHEFMKEFGNYELLEVKVFLHENYKDEYCFILGKDRTSVLYPWLKTED